MKKKNQKINKTIKKKNKHNKANESPESQLNIISDNPFLESLHKTQNEKNIKVISKKSDSSIDIDGSLRTNYSIEIIIIIQILLIYYYGFVICY